MVVKRPRLPIAYRVTTLQFRSLDPVSNFSLILQLYFFKMFWKEQFLYPIVLKPNLNRSCLYFGTDFVQPKRNQALQTILHKNYLLYFSIKQVFTLL